MYPTGTEDEGNESSALLSPLSYTVGDTVRIVELCVESGGATLLLLVKVHRIFLTEPLLSLLRTYQL